MDPSETRAPAANRAPSRPELPAERNPLRRDRAERGSVALLLLAVVAFVAVAIGGLHRLSAATVHRARVDTVADVVALAAVDGAAVDGSGVDGSGVAGAAATARRVAIANGAELLDLRLSGDVVTVQVALGGHPGRASAAPRGPALGDEQSSGRDRQ